MASSEIEEAQPPVGTNVAMAYPRSAKAVKASSPAQGRAWEDFRREARKLESDLEIKMAAYAKLASGYDSALRGKGETGLAADQLAATKAAEIQELLGRLSDANGGLSSCLAGTNDARTHTLARHRDILHDYTQEFRRLDASRGTARDRADLFAGGSGSGPLGGTSNASQLLRERGQLQNTNSALDDVLGQAQAVAGGLGEQRRLFDNVGAKLEGVATRFPLLHGLLNSIRRKKSKDTLVLGGVVATCTLFTFIYWWNK